ncbi:MAG: DUF1616 domain-containing protein [Chloroflexota bacterium]|nr:DUF1616 domain-containing protein [Chloroflexota bacterium]
MSRHDGFWPTVILLSATALGVSVFADLQSPLRAILALGFLFVCPGMAFVPLLRVEDVLTELSLGVALSLSLDALVAGTMLYAGLWSPEWGLALLIVVSLVGALLQIVTARSSPIAGARDTIIRLFQRRSRPSPRHEREPS